MNFKKFLALCLALTMLLTMTACGSKWKVFDETVTTEATVLTSQDGSTITIDPVAYNDGNVQMGVTFYNAAEETRYLELAGLSVNGVMIHTYWDTEADPAQSASETISLQQDELRMKGLWGISSVELMFNINNQDAHKIETLTCKIESSDAKKFQTDDQAYLQAITNEKAQKELAYTIVNKVEERTALGYDVYLNSQVYVNMGDEEFLFLEVINENAQMRYVQIGASTVNGLLSNSAGENYAMFPGTKAVVCVDMDWALPVTMREAFGISEIAEISMFCDVYTYTEEGEIDWDNSGEYNTLSYTNPGKTATLDTSGTVLYNYRGLKISAKSPVQQVTDESVAETYVYMIFENTGDTDYFVNPGYEEEFEVDGTNSNVYFENPYYIGAGDSVFCYLQVDDMTGTKVTMPLAIHNAENLSDSWRIDLTVPF